MWMRKIGQSETASRAMSHSRCNDGWRGRQTATNTKACASEHSMIIG